MKLPDDPIILELLPEFVDDWLQQIDERYSSLVESQSTNDMYRLGHTLKGSCFQFGLDDIAQMGIELMDHAKEGRWEEAAALKIPLQKEFLRIKEFIVDKQEDEVE
jgi:HPt (histidine-containing phosphotransfer) domain-containing protein